MPVPHKTRQDAEDQVERDKLNAEILKDNLALHNRQFRTGIKRLPGYMKQPLSIVPILTMHVCMERGNRR